MFDFSTYELLIIGVMIIVALFIFRVISRTILKVISVIFTIFWIVRIVAMI